MHYQVRPRGPETPLLSVILVDWSARESFHSLSYLNNQTFPRAWTELIWVEFYDRRPPELRDAIENPASRMALDAWIVLDRPAETYYHKHEMYNAGLIAASGEICIICDSDAMYAETFLHSVYHAFRQGPGQVVHVDQVRSENRSFYPFTGPSVRDFMSSPGLINWTGSTTEGLDDLKDPLHTRNYGACMCARRQDLIEIGGADEHLDYLGYICGPHEMTFRLVNAGRREKWIDHEWTYHAWHPGQSGQRNYGGPHDGRNFSLRTLELIQNGQVAPAVENPAVAALRQPGPIDRRDLLGELASRDCVAWTNPEEHLDLLDPVVLVEENVAGYNILRFGDLFVGLAQSEGSFSRERLHQRVYAAAYVASTVAEVKQAMRDGPGSAHHVSRAAMLSAPPLPGPAGALAPDAIAVPFAAPRQAVPGAAVDLDGPKGRVRSRLASQYGQALYDAGATLRALAVFEFAVANDPGNRIARKGLGNARIAEGRAARAREDFDDLLAAIPAHHAAERCEALVGRAWAQYHLGNWVAAIDDFSAALPLAEAAASEDLIQNIYQGRSWSHARAGLRHAASDDFQSCRRTQGRAVRGFSWLAFRLFGLRGRLARARRRARAPRNTPAAP
jgi:hypothetical protein